MKEAFRSIRANARMTISSICTIAVCFIILGAAILLYTLLNNAIENEMSNAQYVAYIDDTLTEEQAQTVGELLQNIDNVGSISFITRDVAKAEFAEYLHSAVINELPSDIFRHRYVITLTDISLASQTQWKIEATNGVAEVSGDPTIAAGYETMHLGLRIIALALISLIIIISFVVIHNALSASFEKRRAQTYILRLCGVSETYIRHPYVCEGMFIGITASIIAIVLLGAFYQGLYVVLREQGIAQMLNMETFLSAGMEIVALFLAIGCLLGLIAGQIVPGRKQRKHKRGR